MNLENMISDDQHSVAPGLSSPIMNPPQFAAQLINNGRIDAGFANEFAVNLAKVCVDKLQQQQGHRTNTAILIDRFLSGVALLDLASTKVALTHLADQLSEKNVFCHEEGGLTREFGESVVKAGRWIKGITPKKLAAIDEVLMSRCRQAAPAASVKVITDFRALMTLAKELGAARQSGDPEAIAVAQKAHDEYARLCLDADEMTLGSTWGALG